MCQMTCFFNTLSYSIYNDHTILATVASYVWFPVMHVLAKWQGVLWPHSNITVALRTALFFVVHMRYHHTCSPLNSSSQTNVYFSLFRWQNLQRFISTMSKATKRKHVVKEVLEDYVTPTEDQNIMRVQLQCLRSVKLWELCILLIPWY